MKRIISTFVIALICMLTVFGSTGNFQEWKIKPFLDIFGDPNGNYYACYEIEDGTTTYKSVSKPAKIMIIAWLSNSPLQTLNFKIEIHEDSWNTPAIDLIPNGFGMWQFKKDNGKRSTISQDVMHASEFHDFKAYRLYKILSESKVTKIYTNVNETEYLFTVSNINLNNCIEQLKESYKGQHPQLDMWNAEKDDFLGYKDDSYEIYTNAKWEFYGNESLMLSRLNIKLSKYDTNKKPLITYNFFSKNNDLYFKYDDSYINKLAFNCGDEEYVISYKNDIVLKEIPYEHGPFNLKDFCKHGNTISISLILDGDYPERTTIQLDSNELLKHLQSQNI